MPKIGSLGLPEILIILVVVLLIFGPRRLPEMAKGLGQSVREFRKGLRDMRKDLDDEGSQSAASKGASVAAATVQPNAGASPVGPGAPVASEAVASGAAASGPATEAADGATEAAPASRDA